ncbi:hypothetical protein [Streptomyces sp. NRRL F-5123]|uniref:hypothetical protein n=1 Tax=Streptomyces sp. NRRL F-5123 TaxID=1463856 RepID=UPI0004E1C3CF|nr:hypothetical protein [Streptomyces sp. NRRL F-5123]
MTAADLPEPTPADTAALDQLAAQWRDLPPDQAAAVVAAAHALRDNPGESAAADLFAALQRAGFDTAPEPD